MDCWQLAIDWSGIGDFLAGLAAIAAACTAIWGLATWRSNKFEKAKYDAAANCLDSAMAFGELLRHALTWVYLSHREPDVPKLRDESEDEWKRRRSFYLPHLIFNENAEVTVALRTSIHKAKAWLSVESSNSLRELYDLQNELLNDFREAAYHEEQDHNERLKVPRNQERITYLASKHQTFYDKVLPVTPIEGPNVPSPFEDRISALEAKCADQLSEFMRR